MTRAEKRELARKRELLLQAHNSLYACQTPYMMLAEEPWWISINLPVQLGRVVAEAANWSQPSVGQEQANIRGLFHDMLKVLSEAEANLEALGGHRPRVPGIASRLQEALEPAGAVSSRLQSHLSGFRLAPRQRASFMDTLMAVLAPDEEPVDVYPPPEKITELRLLADMMATATRQFQVHLFHPPGLMLMSVAAMDYPMGNRLATFAPMTAAQQQDFIAETYRSLVGPVEDEE